MLKYGDICGIICEKMDNGKYLTSFIVFNIAFSIITFSASKAALINLTKSLALNYGEDGIRVNAVSPGWINTGMATESSYEAAKLAPLGRNGKPEEIADLVYFLSTKKASFITGSNIVADGGYSCVDYIMKKESSEVEV